MTAVVLYYVDQVDFENKIGAELVRAFLDDDNDGSPDGGPVRQLLGDAEDTCEGYWRQAGYDIAQLRLLGLRGCKRQVLQVARAEAYIRHPEIARFDGYKEMERVVKELRDMSRPGGFRLDVPEGAAGAPTNVGGSVGAIGGGPTPDSVFADLGDFC